MLSDKIGVRFSTDPLGTILSYCSIPVLNLTLAAVGSSIGTAVGVSVSVTFVVSFSMGVLVANVLSYISRWSKESFTQTKLTY